MQASSRGEPSEYKLEFFTDNGFMRKRCKVCGAYFWTLDPGREVCEDTPCVTYRFHEVPRRVGSMSVRDVRERFIKFFERNGHTPVKPRPIVARWRDDLYLTIASIVVFQPFVTSGLVPPPANPLVISQPCIRLEDIDNVGITFGRHLTSFEMAAHHAFNYPGRTVYWKNRTVELAYRFFTEEIGIPPDEIVFKESWWEGGGNAGPSFEVTVGGLELATLVFMQYRIRGGEYEPIPLKIVDTGYGVERIAWFTQRESYTAFDAIFRGLVDKFREKLGVDKPPMKIMRGGLRLAGRLNPDNPESVEEFYRKLSVEAGYSVEELKQILLEQIAVYGLLDHTKTLALMLGDGIVPSNAGEGYLARLVLRRAMRLMRRIGVEGGLEELVDMQIDFWGRDFPQLAEHRDYILDAIRYEEDRYRQTLSKGEILIKRMLRKKRRLSLDDLILLYESHGLPPDLVADKAAEMRVEVHVPANFYSLVASRHKAPRTIRRKDTPGIPRAVAEWASRFEETRRLFHEDPYARRFKAKVLGVKDGYIILDQTAFYPRGGGQDADTGLLVSGNLSLRVVDTVKVGGVVLHRVDPAGLPPGLKGRIIEGVIDWERRYQLMRHHTATHIILGAARRVLGDHVWQAGAEKTVEKARLDITHHKPLTKSQVAEIERLANKVILERRRINTRMMERNTAEETYGFRLYQGGVPPDPVIRVVEIEGWDVEACFGTHLSNTGEVGAIKIINVDKIQDGIVRLEYVAGTRVAEEYGRLEGLVEEAARLVDASPRELPRRLSKVLQEFGEAKRRLSEYRRMFVESSVREAEENARRLGRILFYAWAPVIQDEDAVREALRRMTDSNPEIVVLAAYRRGKQTIVEAAAGSIAVERGFDASRMLALLLGRIGGRGGGRRGHATGFTSMRPEIVVEEAWRLAEETYGSA